MNLPQHRSAILQSALAFDSREKTVTELERGGLHNPIAVMVHDAHVAGCKRPAIHDAPVLPFEFGFEKRLGVEAVDTVAVFACGAGNQDVGRLGVVVENSFGNGGGRTERVRSWSSMWSSSSALKRHYLSDLPDWR